MALHFEREIDKLKRGILSLGALVEENLLRGLRALKTNDLQAAEEAIAKDKEIDMMEIDIEEDCLKVLALHQPVAVDLRFIVSVLKINNDLERIGDLAKNIGKRARDLSKLPPVQFPENFMAISEATVSMVHKSLDALVNLDADLAREVCAMDDEVDAHNREMYGIIKEQIRRAPEHVDGPINMLTVSRYLERVGDHATNIAEDVIYMVEGEIIRHSM